MVALRTRSRPLTVVFDERLETKESFEKFVFRLREENTIDNDDTTL